MSNSMQHLNGDQIVAIDIETTGTDPRYHEIIQIAMVPLDSDLKMRQDIVPLNMYIAPEHPERATDEAIKVTNVKMSKAITRGIDKEKAKDVLDMWIDRLGLPLNKYGSYRKKIVPLGHNIIRFDIPFIEYWLGTDHYNEQFDCRPRDTMAIAAYLNDKAACHAETVPFSKLTLTWLASKLQVEWIGHKHDALEDARVTGEVYRRLLNRMFFV